MKTVVVDSHNEVLPYWVEEFLKHKLPFVVVRIDRHHDMSQECPVLPAREGRSIFDYLDKMMPHMIEYAKRRLNEGNFTCPAFHYGIAGSLYHFDPEKENLDAYGRVSGVEFVNSPRTKIKSTSMGGKKINLIVWDDTQMKMRKQGGKFIPAPQNLSIGTFKEDMEESRFPIVIGFDLDGLYGIGDKGSPDKVIGKRLRRAKKVLESVTSPVLACIARSQTPRAYVPPDLVDSLQEMVLHLMEGKLRE